MKLWFIIGVALAVFLTACAVQPDNGTVENEKQEETNNQEATKENETQDDAEEPIGESEEPKACCLAMTASCLACAEDISVEEYCVKNPDTIGCEEFSNDNNELENIIPREPLTNVSCEGNSLTFTLTNTLEETIEFAALPFPAPRDKIQGQLTVNTFNAWSSPDYFSEQSLSECDDGTLNPGESIRCTLKPIPVVTENDFSQNSIVFQAQGFRAQKTFTCS